MSRNPQIEALHEARYELETSAPGTKAEARAKLERLAEEAIQRAGSSLSAKALLDALFDDYKTFRRGKKRAEWPRI